MGEKKALSERFSIALKLLIDTGQVKNKRTFAGACGISPQKLSEILNRRMNVGTDVLQGMLAHYPVRPEYLFGNKKPILKTTDTSQRNTDQVAEPQATYGKKGEGTEIQEDKAAYLELLHENSRLKDKVIELMEEIERLKREEK